MSPVILPQLIKQYTFMPVGIYSSQLLTPKQAKNGYVTMALKQQEKNGNIFFLSRKEYIFLHENVCLTLSHKKAQGITQRPTLYWITYVF